MKKIAYIGLLSALTYVLTTFVRLPIPFSKDGYIHMGNIAIIIAACLIDPVSGGIIGAIGSAFADLTVAPVWIPYTIVIKFILGVFTGVGFYKSKAAAWLLYLVAGIVFVGGYYAAEAIITGNWLVPFKSTPFLVTEYFVSLAVSLIILKKSALKKLDMR